MATTHEKTTQLVYLGSLFNAFNKTCRDMRSITYTSGDSNVDNDRDLDDFQLFLCKLAQICDTSKGGDTITALVALKDANGPRYLFASNNRSGMHLQGTETFIRDLLDYVGTNPDNLGEKPMQKKVLWRILDFNFPRVDFYLRQVVVFIRECIHECHPHLTEDGLNMRQVLVDMETKAKFPRDIQAGLNAKQKFLSDCETFIKAIHFGRENGVSEAINRRAGEGGGNVSPWCELRHYFGRLHSFRQAAECIVRASKVRPELFSGFTVDSIASSRPVKHFLPRHAPSTFDAIQAAFPGQNLEEYHDEIENLQEHNLDSHIRDELPLKSIRQIVHCEVHLQDFLVSDQKVEPSVYWENSMFIATSKPPCRLCHFYFNDHDNDFQVRSSHKNVYTKWRLPDMRDGQGENADERRDELIEEIIEKMQDATLEIVKEQYPQGQRNDSRTESRGISTRLDYNDVDISGTRDSSRPHGKNERIAHGRSSEGQFGQSRMTAGDHDFVEVGAAIGW